MSIPEFLQWALPRLRLRWKGFRRVYRQVGKRLRRRLEELQLPDPAAYRGYLETHPDEWDRLDAMCRITITRMFRDPEVWEFLERRVLPVRRVWSAGCGTGEEAYSVWRLCKGQAAKIVATDIDERLIEHARATYDRDIEFLVQDIRREMPDGPFDLILCRNLVFTYFDEALQRELLDRIRERLEPGGYLAVGRKEVLPEPMQRVGPSIYQVRSTSGESTR